VSERLENNNMKHDCFLLVLYNFLFELRSKELKIVASLNFRALLSYWKLAISASRLKSSFKLQFLHTKSRDLIKIRQTLF